MKSSQQSLLLTAVAICAIVMMAFVGISAFVDGDPQPALLLFVSAVTPTTAAVVVLLKSDRTLKETQKAVEVSESTDKKVDDLLNGSLQGKIAALETHVAVMQNTAARNSQRIGNIETTQIEILAHLSELTKS